MADEHSTTTTTTGDRPATTHTTTTTTSSGGAGTGLVIGALVVLLLVVGWLFLGGDADTAGDTVNTEVNVEAAPDTTEVVEPGAADGGPDEPLSTEANDAGTAADTATGGSGDTNTTGN